MEWQIDDYIQMWYFPRTTNHQSIIPSGLAFNDNNDDQIDTATLGIPYIRFDLKEECSEQTHVTLKRMKMVLNITLCGEWAGKSRCSWPGADEAAALEMCNEYVMAMTSDSAGPAASDVNAVFNNPSMKFIFNGFKFFL